MAGTISGLGGQQQQVPAANTFKPGGDANDIRQGTETQPRENTVQPQGTAPAQAQNSETGNYQNLNAQDTNEDALASGSKERGSLVNIVV